MAYDERTKKYISYSKNFESMKGKKVKLEKLIPMIVQHAYVLATVEEDEEDRFTVSPVYKITTDKYRDELRPKLVKEYSTLVLTIKASDNDASYIDSFLDDVYFDTKKVLKPKEPPFESDGDEPDDGYHINDRDGINFELFNEVGDEYEFIDLGYGYAIPFMGDADGNKLVLEFVFKTKDFNEGTFKNNLSKVKKDFDEI